MNKMLLSLPEIFLDVFKDEQQELIFGLKLFNL